jgi:hypothetical protein
VLVFVERRGLMGKGLGWIDVFLNGDNRDHQRTPAQPRQQPLRRI